MPHPHAVHRSVLNVAFAYAGNQAFVTVMCEMRDPSKDFTPAILWLNVIAIPLYVIIGCVVYSFAVVERTSFTKIPAAPMPLPMHMLVRSSSPLRRRSSARPVTT